MLDLNQKIKIFEELFELDILDASFPCSLFSNANLKADEKKGK